MTHTILVINAGSSSIKFELFDIRQAAPERRFKGLFERIGGSKPHLIAREADGSVLIDRSYAPEDTPDLGAAMPILGAWLREHLEGRFPVAFGHRVVHGGPRFDQPVLVDEKVLAELEKYVPLAPLHQPNNLAPIRAIRDLLPEVPQVACFDTAFHRSHGELADRYAIPEIYYEEGIRRYGFHGLSYEYIASVLPKALPEVAGGRVIAAHLGNGASLCALQAGRSIDSSMGFTALEGLPMGTRPGQLDPGVVLYLIMQKGMSPAAVEQMLYHDCGLKGLSGIGGDVRDLLASGDPRAKLALDYYAYRIAKEVGALSSSLGGLDALVFTAGVGENAVSVRKAVAERLAWLGIALDDEANAVNATRISQAGSRPLVAVVPTDEELMIATHALSVIGASLAA